MAKFRFSRLAETDLHAIATYTLRRWGPDQASRYLDGLEVCCQTLADNPGIGRACDDIRPDLKRFVHASSVVFYRREADGILISRILHERMLPKRTRFSERDPAATE